jgi:hypothetical protein
MGFGTMSRGLARGASVGGLLICLGAALALRQSPVASTGRLSGVVVIEGTQGTPVRGAIVTVRGAALARARSVLTDDAGSFVVAGLPAGRFTVSASKAPFVRMAFGATRPGRQGTAVVLAAGQAIDGVMIGLPRGGVITGMLRDQEGQAAPDVEVWALTSTAAMAEVPLSTIPSATTDDRGVYRIYGLPAGVYVVAATVHITGVGDLAIPSTEEVDRLFAALERPMPNGRATPPASAQPADTAPPPRVFGYAPTFFPGVASAADAASVTVVAGEERRADFTVGPVPTGTVEGTIQTQDGTPLPPVTPSLVVQGSLALPMFGAQPTLAMRPGPDGRFRFTGVAPGRYALSANTGSGSSARWAIADVSSTGDDLTGITLTLRPGMHLSGTVVVDNPAGAPALDLTKVRLVLTATRAPIRLSILTPAMPVVATGSAGSGGRFEVPDILPGSYTISTEGLGQWTVRSAMVNGRDAVDVPIEFANGADITDAIVTLSDRSAELSGTLQTAAHTSATEYFVVVFSTDPSVWRPGARRVRSTRPGSDGRFVVSDLPGGDYYIAALTDVTPGDLADAAFLTQVAPSAVRVTLADGEKKTQDLRIAGGG